MLVFVLGLLYPALFLFVVAAVAIAAWLRVRRQRTRSITHTLALVVGQNLPLPQALSAAAIGERGKLRKIYSRMSARLMSGDALSVALQSTYPSCPGNIIGSIRAAESGGTLPAVLRSLAADARRDAGDAVSAAPALPYALIMFLSGMLLVLVMGLFLVPKFADILTDFNVSPGPAVARVRDFSVLVTSNSGLFICIVLAIVVGTLQLIIWSNWIGRSSMRPSWFETVIDTPMWYLPGLRRLAEARSLAAQLPVMQAAVSAGHDLSAAAAQAAAVATNVFARRRLTRWAVSIDAGEPPLDAARRLRFPAALLAALREAKTGADLPAALEYLAAYYRSLSGHWTRALASAAMPLVTILWGVCVGYVCVALFGTLFSVVERILDSM